MLIYVVSVALDDLLVKTLLFCLLLIFQAHFTFVPLNPLYIAGIVPPMLFVHGILEFEGPVCNTAFLQQLRNHMTIILTQIDHTVGLCGGQASCNYTKALDATCGKGEEDGDSRVRRDAHTRVYSVRLDLAVTDYKV